MAVTSIAHNTAIDDIQKRIVKLKKTQAMNSKQTEMKNVPKKIYLQVDADGETPEDFIDLAGVSWCADKINDNDIEYVLASLPSKPFGDVEEMDKWLDWFEGYISNQIMNYNNPNATLAIIATLRTKLNINAKIPDPLAPPTCKNCNSELGDCDCGQWEPEYPSDKSGYAAAPQQSDEPTLTIQQALEVWEDACKDLLKDIAQVFLDKSNQAKADTLRDADVFQAVGETIENFPLRDKRTYFRYKFGIDIDKM